MFNVLNEQIEVVPYDLGAYAAIWAVHARLRALTACPPPTTSQLGLGSTWAATPTPQPPDHNPLMTSASVYRLTIQVSEREQQTPSYLGIIILAAMEDIM